MKQPLELSKDEPLLWSPGRGCDVWAMFQACKAGDVGTIRRLLEKDPSLVRANWDYRRPLTFAVQENRFEAVALLLEHGADPVNSGTPDTLLQIARDRGHTRVAHLLEEATAGQLGTEAGEAMAAAIRARDLRQVRNLLDTRPDWIHAKDGGTSQPIHWAAMTRNIPLIDELLDRGADIDAQRGDGARPVQLCNGDYSYRGWRDVPKTVATTPAQVLSHLIARGAYIDLGMASTIGDTGRVKELLRADPASANRVADYVSYYLGSGAPLKNAAARGHIDIVRLLLDHGADPNLPEEGIAPKGHALYAAVSNGHYDIAKLLLEHGAYPNPPVESSADALSFALSRNDRRMVDLLCSYGASRSVNILAYYGDLMTAAAVFDANPALADDPHALENAASEGHLDFVRLMLRHQHGLARRIAVGVRSKGPDGAIKGHEIAELLFGHGMDPNFSNWLGITPLHRFAQRGDLENAELFIGRGADLHARDEEICSTPLGWAAKYGQTAMAELLLRHGATPSHPDDPAWATPLAWAQRRGHGDIAALLKRHEAER